MPQWDMDYAILWCWKRMRKNQALAYDDYVNLDCLKGLLALGRVIS